MFSKAWLLAGMAYRKCTENFVGRFEANRATVYGLPVDEDAVVAELGGELSLGESLSLKVDWTGQAGNRHHRTAPLGNPEREVLTRGSRTAPSVRSQSYSHPRSRNRSAQPARIAAPRGRTLSSTTMRLEWMPQHPAQSEPSAATPRKAIAPGSFSST